MIDPLRILIGANFYLLEGIQGFQQVSTLPARVQTLELHQYQVTMYLGVAYTVLILHRYQDWEYMCKLHAHFLNGKHPELVKDLLKSIYPVH